MSDLGLAVVFCMLQVTLLAAFVAFCYLCSRRTRPGFRSSIASTGVFLVLALSLLCVSPYPNWVEVVERGALAPADSGVRSPDLASPIDRQAEGQVERRGSQRDSEIQENSQSISAGLRPSPELRLPADGRPSSLGGNWSAIDREQTVAVRTGRLFGFANELQRSSGWIVDFRDWLVAKLSVVVRWGWVAGVMLLAGISWNLLRLVVGWWQLRRFRQRSSPILSQDLAECLDVVQAALSLRTPVELRQTSEMTSPATIGWLRPVVILPSDWEEWNEEERLGVLAHELAHVRRHDFLTGLFSQLVLALHFYHPLINWLVNRLHLEQELAADAAAVRVLGGQKPYLKMLAGMALKDHTSSLPVAARTFFPQSGTLMARVELLRGHKVEPGDGSFSWRTAVRGVLVCLGLVVAGLRPLAGADGPKSLDAPLISAFIPEAAAGCLAWRPARVPQDHPVFDLLIDPAKDWPTPLRQSLVQVSLFWVETRGGMGGEANSLMPDGVVLSFDSAKGRNEVFEHLGLHPEQSLGLLMAGGASHRAIQRKVGERELLLCRDETILMFAVLSASANPSSAWNAAWGRVGRADVAVGFRPGFVSRFGSVGASHTAVLEDLVDQLSDWGAVAEFGLAGLDLKKNRCDLQLIPRNRATPLTLLQSFDNLMQNWRGRLGERASSIPGDPETYDPVEGNPWCRLLLDDSRVETLPGRLRIDASLPALLGIGLRLGSDPDGSHDFEKVWSDHQASRLNLAFGLLRSALLAYRSEHGEFPPVALRKDSNSPPYSWRVALLPYLGRQDLFDQYRLNQPWDSPENLQLLSEIPDVYRGFGSFSTTSPFCHGAALEANHASRLLTATEGTEAESIVLFGATSVSIPWTSPADGASVQVPSANGSVSSAGVLAILPMGDLVQCVWTRDIDAPAADSTPAR